MTSAPSTPDAYPYLRAATAGIRHHTRGLNPPDAGEPARPADRIHLDALHTHLTGMHQLLDQLSDTTRTPHPAAARQLATAHTRLWQAATAVHDAFHLLPMGGTPADPRCHPERLPEGPAALTICQRHLAAGHSIRRRTTATDLNTPLHGHTTTCAQ